MTRPEERLRTALSGRYGVERELGSGGMATVYLAEDLKHHRRVALKVLRPELAAVVGAERFLAEIETTANLQHPHILPLFDSGNADGFLYYVMPYVEGESLRDRLDREKQLPIEDAVAITEAVANALDYAHRHDVIHRDIKPANVLLQDGQPVVADFGIALALSHAGGSRLTETGLSVGTPEYMSPEQVTGERDLDGRSDIFALGCVLYEMLAGEPPFKSPSAQGVVARILADDPTSISGQRPSVPPNLAAVVWTSLQKLPADRFRSGAEMAKALSDPGFRRGEAAAPVQRGHAGRWKRLSILGWSLAALLAVGWGVTATRPEEPRPVLRYSPALPAEASIVQSYGNSVAVSPDGSLIAYVGARENGRGLWLKERDSVRPRFLEGSEGAYQATFSPTGDRIAFTSFLAGARALKVLPLDGGAPVILATDGFRPAGLSWGTDGHIYVTAAPDSGLARIRESGGAVERVSIASGAYHYLPHALPNGRGVLMSIRGGLGPSEVSSSSVAVLDLESREHRILVPGLVARYSGSGHILVTRTDSTVVAHPFDQDELNVTGPPVPVLQGVHLQQLIGLAGSVSMDISGDGTLAYVSGGDLPPPRGQVVWVDRSGDSEPVDPAWSVVPHSAGGLGLSPDGSTLVISLSHPSEGLATGTAGLTLDVDVWLKELDTGPQTRLTFRGPDDRAPANVRPRWSPRGDFVTYLNETAGLLRIETDGSGERRLVDFDQPIWDAEVAPNGETVVFRTGWGRGTRDLWIADLASGTAPRPLLAEPFDEQEPDISPNGRWLAYVTNEAGRTEVFVRALQGDSDRRWTVSENGGRSPRWSGSGDELFFIDGDRALWSVAVLSRDDFAMGDRTELFTVPADYHMPADGHHYDVSADGQRFIMIRRTERADPGELIVVEGFFEELKRLVPN